MQEKRRRDKTLTVRLTEKEKRYIEKQAEKSNLNLTNYIVKLSLETSIIVKDDTRPLLIELKRIGNNLNQIATKVHSGAFSSYNFQEVINMQKELNRKLDEIARKE